MTARLTFFILDLKLTERKGKNLAKKCKISNLRIVIIII